jgi:hypothetical protein
MSLDLKLFRKYINHPFGLGVTTPIVDLMGISDQRELDRRGRDKFDESYINYCKMYINEYMDLIRTLYYELFINNSRFLNGIIREQDKASFFQEYADIFIKMFNLNNIEEMLYGEPKVILNKCNIDIINRYEEMYLTKLESLKKIIKLAKKYPNNYEEYDDY